METNEIRKQDTLPYPDDFDDVIEKVQHDNTEARNRHFMAECRRQYRLLSSGRTSEVGIVEVTRAAAMAPAPAYYISYDYALRRVGAIFRHPEQFTGTFSRSSRRAMMMEIAGKCRSLMQKSPRLTLSQALIRVLAFEPASCYFISAKTARRLYFDIQKASHRRTNRLRQRKLF